MIDPIDLDVPVACSPSHAFATWTERFGTWWPRSHSMSGDPTAEVVLEAGVGGRIVERCGDDEWAWGWIEVWEPPHRLVFRWHLRFDAADATEVEVRFDPTDDGTTRLRLVHRDWDRLGTTVGTERRDRNLAGWSGVLPTFVAAAQA